MKNLKSMKDDIAIYAKLKDEFDEIETLIEMAAEENDESLIPEIQDLLDDFRKTYDDIRIKTLLSGEYDKDNAIVTLHAGAGGTESCDWAGHAVPYVYQMGGQTWFCSGCAGLSGW